MKLEEGKFYLKRNGDLVGPMYRDSGDPNYPWQSKGNESISEVWTDKGRYATWKAKAPEDIVSEVSCEQKAEMDRMQPAGVGMTNKEKEAMEHLVNFWNAFLALPDQKSSESSNAVCNAVHMIQGVLAIRVARRANPEIWR